MPEPSTDGASVLLVASTGGHLTQLEELSHRFTARGPHWWVTFDTDQSHNLLTGADVDFIPYLAPRAYFRLLRTLPQAWRMLRDRRPEIVVSTGAGIALAFLPLARLLGIESHYIESATRADGPSVTGRILSWVPGIHLHTQHQALVDRRWSFVGSVFEGYEAVRVEPTPIRRAVVTLGTMESYGFERLLARALEVLPPDTEVVWQTGSTDVSELPVEARASMPSDELDAAIVTADVVIAHAGTGTALTCLRLGKRPILVPRRATYGEHVDDHQVQSSAYLARMGLAAVHEADELRRSDLEDATAWRVRHHVDPGPIHFPGRTTRSPSIRKRSRT